MSTTTPVYFTNVNRRGDRQQAKSCFAAGEATSPPRAGRERGRRSLVRYASGRALLVGALLALVAVSILPAGGTTFAMATPDSAVAVSGGALSPAADAIDDIIDILKQIEEDLAKAAESVGEGSGRPTPPSPTNLAYYLDDAEDLIDQIFDPLTDPSLNPSDAGAVDPTVTPITLQEHADDCLLLAEQAEDEAEFGCPPDHDVIGSKLKTIKSCLPGYRAAAGL